MNIEPSRTTEPNLDAVFAALADPTRRAILTKLTTGTATVNELAAPFQMSQPAISKHLKVLEHAGLIERSIEKQKRPAKLRAEPITHCHRDPASCCFESSQTHLNFPEFS